LLADNGKKLVKSAESAKQAERERSEQKQAFEQAQFELEKKNIELNNFKKQLM
jgi:hypothetical protein